MAAVGKIVIRGYSVGHVAGKDGVKVAVLGAAGGIGQPLSLLTKLNPYVSELALYDIVNTPGVAADLSHINTRAKTTGYKGADQLGAAVKDADLVLVPAGMPRKPGMTRDDLFNKNADIVRNIAEACGKYAPKAILGIISNPVNSTVPIVAETLKKLGTYDPTKVFGVTTLDIVRASTFVAELKGGDSTAIHVPVIGGHSGPTIVPLLSQTGLSFTQEELDKLTFRIQYGGDEVVKAKDGAGSATLSMAFAADRFARSVLDAVVGGKKGVIECSYVESPIMAKEGIKYFSTKIELGTHGLEKIHPIGPLTPYEEKL
ncbi:malate DEHYDROGENASE, NAD-dependent, partial [Gonapodya sp. JEL0774]